MRARPRGGWRLFSGALLFPRLTASLSPFARALKWRRRARRGASAGPTTSFPADTHTHTLLLNRARREDALHTHAKVYPRVAITPLASQSKVTGSWGEERLCFLRGVFCLLQKTPARRRILDDYNKGRRPRRQTTTCVRPSPFCGARAGRMVADAKERAATTTAPGIVLLPFLLEFFCLFSIPAERKLCFEGGRRSWLV